MKCQFCEREISNKGGLIAHQNSCAENPNKITRVRSPNAGAKKGIVPWNAGKKQTDKVLKRVIDAVESGALENYSEPAARRTAKYYLIHTQGHKCSRCGVTEWMNEPVPLVCDHISGDSTDNRIENFRLLCCNCDGQMPTFKSKNNGNGRVYDRSYKQKKSAVLPTT